MFASIGPLRAPRLRALILGLSLALAACGPGASSTDGTSNRSSSSTAAVSQDRPRGTLKIAWPNEPNYLSPKFLSGAGNGEYQWMFNSTLTSRDLSGASHPILAKDIPSQDNGDWIINPDGTMVTVYHLRENTTWHDGTPLTAPDFVFAFEVYLDKDLPIQQPDPEPLMARVEAKDDHSLVITWKEPYPLANVLGFQALNPLPRQQLEDKYRNARATFALGDEWTTSYIGSGPFRVERWTPGVGILARAHLGWALGPPKLDAIDIRFISDPNTELANVLSGEVDMINSPGVRAQEAAIARDQWGGQGYVKAWVTRTAYMEFQYREVPGWQRAVADVRVRQALISAIDREGLADVIDLGFGTAADAFIAPTDELFPEVDRAIVKYPHNVARAVALLEDAGWRRPPQGGPLVDASGRTLDVDLTATSAQAQIATIVANNWKDAGVTSSTTTIPPARVREGELRAGFPAAALNGRTIGAETFVWTTSNFPTPDNRFAGSNRGSFSDPEVDRLQKIRLTSLNERERSEATIAVLKRMTELVGAQPLIYSVEVIIARNGVRGPVGNYGPQEGITWNVQDWSVD
ncbi:MAG TPA: ABC transporter substrate-binding protein [Chloroflexota bacterium]|nr:ABC transporter substrate-binding protein [Chloroflexota bacterium]